ncbi:MAG: hypothetical protein R3A12_03255 [Ignavibacteria bacterium]
MIRSKWKTRNKGKKDFSSNNFEYLGAENLMMKSLKQYPTLGAGRH